MPARGRPPRSAIHARLDAAARELRERLGGLPQPAEAEQIWTGIWYHEAHNSTAIEGNTLVLAEVERLLAEGKAVGNKELKDYLEVRGYATAAQWVYSQGVGAGEYGSDDLLTLTDVRHVHRLAMGPVWDVAPHPQALPDEAPGNWRRHDIQPFPGGMRPPSHPDIPALVRDWVDEVCRLRDAAAPPAEAVARQHAAFERIHPFLDGNGRAGRLVANLVLVRLGYPPTIIRKRERARYLAALGRADRGDAGPLGELFARAILENLTRFILPAVAYAEDLLPLAALATPDVRAQALSIAAHRGRLRALRADDGTWRSTRRWVDEYVARRWSRAPGLVGQPGAGATPA